MNIKTLNILIFLSLFIIACLGTFYKHISFGMGLGDIFGYLVLYASVLTYSIFLLVFRKKESTCMRFKFLALFYGFILIFGCLKATILRGSQYSWNGSLFYTPCPIDLEIIESGKSKFKLVSMCTMSYYSIFNGPWNGETIELKGGKIKVPVELEGYIEYPITKVYITPEVTLRTINDSSVYVNNFEPSDLEIGKHYLLKGDIIKIKDGVPVLEVLLSQ